MIRQHVVGLTGHEKGFRWRGSDITRLEGFSDAVFAFAVTLLVVSLEVPKTFRELMGVVQGTVGFGVCFALLAVVWYNHYRFFRRYGLQDSPSVMLNCLLLFCVLVYVYPLKFLFFGLFGGLQVGADDARTLFVVYGSGYAAVFGALAGLYLHAWRKRDALELTPLERLKTRHSLIDQCAMVLVGLLSILLACILPLRWIGMAGFFYCVIAVYFTVAGTVLGRREQLLFESTEAEAAIVN